MKSRSHRLAATSDTADDWVDESWTVDCVCGVNYDDGEEMVNCDECGVWVHTRCSRYVKSEKLFACDNCKAKKCREESEVAQLLVELPTKTVRLDRLDNGVLEEEDVRPGADLEDRVHVHGVPGGDPSLYRGVSSVFGPELWKCTGYVPKKFNFQYREFPCWDDDDDEEEDDDDEEEDEDGEGNVEKNDTPAGAGVLFSMFKKSVFPRPAAVPFEGVKRVSGSLARSIDTKEAELEDSNVRQQPHSTDGSNKESSLLKPIVIHSGKQNKEEDSVKSKDLREKKRHSVVDKDQDSRHRSAHFSKPERAKIYEGNDKLVKIDVRSSKHGNLRVNSRANPSSAALATMGNTARNIYSNLSCNGQLVEKPDPTEERQIEEIDGHEVSVRFEASLGTDGVSSSMEHNDMGTIAKVDNGGVGNIKGSGRVLSKSEGSKSLDEDMPAASRALESSLMSQDPSFRVRFGLSRPMGVNADVELNAGESITAKSSSSSDVKLDNSKNLVNHSGCCVDPLPKYVAVNDAEVPASEFGEQKLHDVDRTTQGVDVQLDTSYEPPFYSGHSDRNFVRLESQVIERKSSPESKNVTKPSEGSSVSSGTAVNRSPLTSQRKMAAAVENLSSCSNPPDSVRCEAENAETHNPSAKQKGTSENSHSSKSYNASTDATRDDFKHERPEKKVKELLKSSTSMKSIHSSNSQHAPSPKKTSSDLKDSVVHSSSKVSAVESTADTLDSGKTALQSENASDGENMITATGSALVGDKMSKSNCQPGAKANYTPSVLPPAPTNTQATLSDEELALLLHQELNSSPRVPRVPRMRHAGSVPQLSSPTSAIMLMKRATSSGGKDHGLAFKRKNRDLAKDGHSDSHEIDAGTKRGENVPALLNERRSNSIEAVGLQSVKNSILPGSTTVSVGPSSSTEANEQSASSKSKSPKNPSYSNVTDKNGRPIHRTLPALIAEIMSEGKRMTYKELCNAVEPHWSNLRKHNGERYAYSSASQAVLDCLRNRSEWARLVDRGPKTTASRKRHKPEADHQSIESEDNYISKYRNRNDKERMSFDSSRDDFPKRKRNARKRKGLELHRKGVKDVTKRRKTEVPSDDDIDSYSDSSEESMFSSDDEQAGGSCHVTSEVSASSDGMGPIA